MNLFAGYDAVLQRLQDQVSKIPRFHLGVVTQTGPLRVRPDFHPVPLAGRASNFAGTLEVGDRVLILIFGRRIAVIGKSGSGGYAVSPENYGAVGDGATDDTAAWQAAADFVGGVGGGKISGTPGKTYSFAGYVKLSPNTVIDGNGSIFDKPVDRTSVACFAIQSNGNLGYGAGGKNFHFVNIHLTGHADQARAATLLSAHHADNITVDKSYFYMCSHRGHVVDLNGARSVRVRNSVFEGSSDRAGDVAGECVQVDISAEDSMSVKETAAGAYDELPSLDVLVEGCTFKSTVHNTVYYPAPIPFGSHSSSKIGLLYEDLKFINNTCGPTQDRVEGVRGVVRFVSTKSAVVSGNTFDGEGVDNRMVSVQSGYGEGAQTQSGSIIVANNTMLNVGKGSEQAIQIGRTDHAVIVGNVILGDKSIETIGNTVLITNTKTAIVNNNVVDMPTHAQTSAGYGIRINTSVLDGIVVGNTVRMPTRPDGGHIFVPAGDVVRGENATIALPWPPAP